jgi:hypothetical protein
VCSSSTLSPIVDSNDVIGEISSFHSSFHHKPMLEPPNFEVIVYSYKDAPTVPLPPHRLLKVSSFIGTEVLKVLVYNDEHACQYNIAVKLPYQFQGDSKKIRQDALNSDSFKTILSYLRRNNVVAVFTERGRIGFVVPNEGCDYSARVVYYQVNDAIQRIKALKQEDKKSLEREEELVTDLEERRRRLFVVSEKISPETSKFVLKCMMIVVDNIDGLNVDLIKRLFGKFGEVSWQGKSCGMALLVMPCDVGTKALMVSMQPK